MAEVSERAVRIGPRGRQCADIGAGMGGRFQPDGQCGFDHPAGTPPFGRRQECCCRQDGRGKGQTGFAAQDGAGACPVRQAAVSAAIEKRLRACTAWPVAAQEPVLGADLPGLLSFARTQSPELRAMQAEADAAAQRVGPAGAPSSTADGNTENSWTKDRQKVIARPGASRGSSTRVKRFQGPAPSVAAAFSSAGSMPLM